LLLAPTVAVTLVPAGFEGETHVRHRPVFPVNGKVVHDPTAACQLAWLLKVITAAPDRPAVTTIAISKIKNLFMF